MYFSVIIPLYNKERHIERAILSVINQTYQKFEIIVIDDGSTDKSVERLKSINDSRIKLIKKKNGGVSSARNKGIVESRYDYIGFLDADDAWKPDFLETINRLIEKHPNAGAYCTAYEMVGKNESRRYCYNYEKFSKAWYGIVDDYFKYALNGPLISASSVVIPKVVFNAIGGFPIGIKRGEDLDMWIRVALNYDIAYFNIICATYYNNSDNRATQRNANLKEYAASYAEEVLIREKNQRNNSIFFEEYMIQRIISKTKIMITNDNCKEARELLFKYRYSKLNKKLILKTYILSFIPNSLVCKLRQLKHKI